MIPVGDDPLVLLDHLLGRVVGGRVQDGKLHRCPLRPDALERGAQERGLAVHGHADAEGQIHGSSSCPDVHATGPPGPYHNIEPSQHRGIRRRRADLPDAAPAVLYVLLGVAHEDHAGPGSASRYGTSADRSLPGQRPPLPRLSTPSVSRAALTMRWPWTAGSQSVPLQPVRRHPLPRVSIVTPSYNQNNQVGSLRERCVSPPPRAPSQLLGSYPSQWGTPERVSNLAPRVIGYPGGG
jgi:hypothetical protein